MSKPIIGFTSDRSDIAEDIECHYFIRKNYCDAIHRGGGVPVMLPYHVDSIDSYLNMIDALVITGGMFDIDPFIYGMAERYPGHMTFKRDRTDFELAMLRGALARDMPVLGICGGMQLIAVEMGANLVQHIPSEITTTIEHKQTTPCNVGQHAVSIARGSRLHAILGVETCMVNSLHHQSVASCNAGLKIGAVAPDGVIEAIEAANNTFCIGVQWHPEYAVNEREGNLFTALVTAAKQSSRRLA